MNSKDLTKLKNIKEALEDEETVSEVQDAVIVNPAREVENSLVSFVTYRFKKVQQSVKYEEDVKKVIMDRIAEASFPQLISLLQTVQKGNSEATMALLAPFIDQSNGRTLPENLREIPQEKSLSDDIYNETEDKETLQAFTALNQILEHISSEEKKEDSLTEIPDPD